MDSRNTCIRTVRTCATTTRLVDVHVSITSWYARTQTSQLVCMCMHTHACNYITQVDQRQQSKKDSKQPMCTHTVHVIVRGICTYIIYMHVHHLSGSEAPVVIELGLRETIPACIYRDDGHVLHYTHTVMNTKNALYTTTGRLVKIHNMYSFISCGSSSCPIQRVHIMIFIDHDRSIPV